MSPGLFLLFCLIVALAFVAAPTNSNNTTSGNETESLTEQKQNREFNSEDENSTQDNPIPNDLEELYDEDDEDEESLEKKIEELREQAGLDSSPEPDFKTDRD